MQSKLKFCLKKIYFFPVFLLFGVLIFLQGCISDKETTVSIPLPPPTPEPQRLPYQQQPHLYPLHQDNLIRFAAEHRQFIQDLRTYADRPPETATDLEQAFKRLSSYKSDRLGKNFLAYLSLVAINQKDFAQSVLEKAGEMGRNAFVQRLYQDPDFIQNIPHYNDALAEMRKTAFDHIHSFRSAGRQYKSYANSLQRKHWAQKTNRNQKSKLSYLKYPPKTLVSQQHLSDLAAGHPFHTGTYNSLGAARALNEPSSYQHPSYNTPPSYKHPAYHAMLNLAALWLVDALDPKMNAYISSILGYYDQNFCFSFARKNLSQCIAAGHFRYEDAYCIAEHILNDCAQCMQKINR